MAERKKKSMLPWILGIGGIAALGYFGVRYLNKKKKSGSVGDDDSPKRAVKATYVSPPRTMGRPLPAGTITRAPNGVGSATSSRPTVLRKVMVAPGLYQCVMSDGSTRRC